MCGIVGYIGQKKACPILINGLLALEYRGYDSAGIAVLENNDITIKKDKGRVQNLQDIINNCNLNSTVGIAHTRWATHGKPSKENAHPHIDNEKKFAVVHNGIIENYTYLREFLKNKGYKFTSETDTEIIPNLIDYYYSTDSLNDENKFLRSISTTISALEGSYAIAVISPLYPDCIIVARKDSPLVIGKGINENFIASDIPALLNYTKDFYLLDNNELAIINKNSIRFYNKNLQELQKKEKNIEWDANSADKNGYADFMLKEIFEQPNAIRETIGVKLSLNDKIKFDDLNISKEYLENVNRIYIVACGTAMHAGLVGKTAIENLCNIQTYVDIASEFRYRNPIIDSNTLCIFISQSGETADTIAALKLAKSKGAKTIAISNVIGSSITRESDFCIYTHAGPEIAVASTKAYTSQVVLIVMLAIHFSEILNSYDEIKIKELKKDILELPSKIDEVLQGTENIKNFADKIYTEKNVFYIGRGTDYNVALEGSLKLKEISYIHSEAYPAGELKHGPIALIEDGITVIGIITDDILLPKTISNIQEVITRGAKVLLITNKKISSNTFDHIINIPNISTLLSPILSVIPLQLLSYYISKDKELDVDKPRNLAKSVTVE